MKEKGSLANAREKIIMLEAKIFQANKDTVTKFQLIAWCAASFALGLIIGFIL